MTYFGSHIPSVNTRNSERRLISVSCGKRAVKGNWEEEREKVRFDYLIWTLFVQNRGVPEFTFCSLVLYPDDVKMPNKTTGIPWGEAEDNRRDLPGLYRKGHRLSFKAGQAKPTRDLLLWGERGAWQMCRESPGGDYAKCRLAVYSGWERRNSWNWNIKYGHVVYITTLCLKMFL